MTERFPLRPLTPAEFDAFQLTDQHAFHGSPVSAEERAHILTRFEFDRSLAAFDGSKPVGGTVAFSFRLRVPGADVPAAGVSWVAVLPTYRRQGILRSLMRQQLTDVRDRGEALAVLWASESVLYGRYGYGRASWTHAYTIRRGEGGLAADAPADHALRLRIAEPVQAQAELAKVYEAAFETRPGLFRRNPAGSLPAEPGRVSSGGTTPGGTSSCGTRRRRSSAGPRCGACWPRTTRARVATPSTTPPMGGTRTRSWPGARSRSGSWSRPIPQPARRCGATCSAGT
jgi:predicted N-acetyltransferase YhbS